MKKEIEDQDEEIVVREVCLNCKKKMITLRKILEDGQVKGDIIRVCTTKGCFARVNVDYLKGSWEKYP